jgi:hypothetical protein
VGLCAIAGSFLGSSQFRQIGVVWSHLPPGNANRQNSIAIHQNKQNTYQEPAARSGVFSRSVVIHGGCQHSFAHLAPVNQVVTLGTWSQRWQEGQLAAEEKRILKSNLYFKNELLMMLEQAGFADVIVQGDTPMWRRHLNTESWCS